MATIARRIFELAAWQLRIPIGSLSMTTDLDSLARYPEDIWWLIRFLEREWGIDIPDQLSLETLGELVDDVRQAIEKKKPKRGVHRPPHRPPHRPIAA